ncbi:MAG: hypothetical protein AMXMBFR4_22870 [Candidatus Hydrogenedentota bacterium]
MSRLEVQEVVGAAVSVALGVAIVIATFVALGHNPRTQAPNSRVSAAVSAAQPKLGISRYNTTDIRALPATHRALR